MRNNGQAFILVYLKSLIINEYDVLQKSSVNEGHGKVWATVCIFNKLNFIGNW